MAVIQTLEFRTAPRIAALLVLLVNAFYSSTVFYVGFFTAVLLMGNVEVSIDVPKLWSSEQQPQPQEPEQQPPQEPQERQEQPPQSEEFLPPPECFEYVPHVDLPPPLTQEHEE